MKKLDEYKNPNLYNAIVQLNNIVINYLENTDIDFLNLNENNFIYGTPKNQQHHHEKWNAALYSAIVTKEGVYVKAQYRGETYNYEFELQITDNEEKNYEAFAKKYWSDDDDDFFNLDDSATSS